VRVGGERVPFAETSEQALSFSLFLSLYAFRHTLSLSLTRQPLSTSLSTSFYLSLPLPLPPSPSFPLPLPLSPPLSALPPPDLCTQDGLSTSGDEKALRSRHQTFMDLYASECDARLPHRPPAALAAVVAARERATASSRVKDGTKEKK